MAGGSTKIGYLANPKREEFQDRLDRFLIERNSAVKLEDTF